MHLSLHLWRRVVETVRCRQAQTRYDNSGAVPDQPSFATVTFTDEDGWLLKAASVTRSVLEDAAGNFASGTVRPGLLLALCQGRQRGSGRILDGVPCAHEGGHWPRTPTLATSPTMLCTLLRTRLKAESSGYVPASE